MTSIEESIQNFVEDVVKSHRLVGVAVGIIKELNSSSELCFGFRDLQNKEFLSPDSLFHLASISKLFTATGVMQLVETGKLSLDTLLLDIVPEIKIAGHFGKEITLQHLLSHTSGIPDITNYGWDSPEYDEMALERYIHSLEIDLLFAPGTKFSYSNLAYEILGYLISKVSGISFEEYIATHVLSPLEMTTSTHLVDTIPNHLRVTPHVNVLETKISEIYPFNRAHAPSSTLHSSVHEMNRWAMANLNHGSLSGKTILEFDTYDTMWSPQISVGQPGRPHKFAGLGWFLDKRLGYSFVYHSGQDIGFSTYFLLIPSASLGITVLCNTEPAPVEALAFGIMDILLGFTPEPVVPAVFQLLSIVYANSGVDGMKKAYLELFSKNPEAYDFGIKGFLEKCASLLDQNLNDHAVRILSFVNETFPDNAAGYEMLARAHFQMGDYSNALEAALKSLEINPDNEFLRQQIKPLLSS